LELQSGAGELSKNAKRELAAPEISYVGPKVSIRDERVEKRGEGWSMDPKWK
jgi:hypothetical protein